MAWPIWAAIATVAAGAGGDVALLEKLWPGLHDSTEQTVVNSEHGLVAWTEGLEHRVRTVVAPVQVPWLGPDVLYLEEFYQDEPDQLRRQLLLQLSGQGPPEAAVRVHLFSFSRPGSWSHLDRRPGAASKLQPGDLLPSSGCDLVLRKDGDQFIGGTLGHGCVDSRGREQRYVDYQLVIGPDIYWYHRRVLTLRGDDLREEVIGYNWFELNQATLFTCRIDWSPTGRARDLRPLRRIELRDEGGRAQFSTPDGRTLDLVLHSQDWPFLGERDALILMLQEEHRPQPITVGSAWSEIDTQNVSLELDWLRVRCGPLVPDTDELSGAVTSPVEGRPAGGRLVEGGPAQPRSAEARPALSAPGLPDRAAAPG
jgi:hypothetical protein